ncbi:hypothetical protein BKN51_20900 [Amycolatopsis sp. BJA-103]|nr:hypothetical protein BKN51_20900 [Amycolatopsis sp. BJA-103]
MPLLDIPDLDVVAGFTHAASSVGPSSQLSKSERRMRIWLLGSLMHRGATFFARHSLKVERARSLPSCVEHLGDGEQLG